MRLHCISITWEAHAPSAQGVSLLAEQGSTCSSSVLSAYRGTLFLRGAFLWQSHSATFGRAWPAYHGGSCSGLGVQSDRRTG